MDKWIDAVKKRGKIISLSEIEIDEDLLNTVQTYESEYNSIDSWIITKEGIQEFWEWMPVHIHWPEDEDEDEKKNKDQFIIYYVNVWKSSPKFKTFICVREVNMVDFHEVEERPDIKQDWIIDQLNGRLNINF
uniref:Uncharacterized protein n=1 Tax=Pithovirus LCPAC404 TaxID=2506597 RepID=A0A481ZD77_9VIRU|nr:MAG: hypothetical protein LCPAC404_01490 [Pithovirus LCPAC404]